MSAPYPVMVTVDHNVGAAYIQLGSNPVAETIEMTPEIQVDIDKLGVAVGIEILSLGANIPITEIATRFHIHSTVVERIRKVRPSISSFVASFSSTTGNAAPAVGSVQSV